MYSIPSTEITTQQPSAQSSGESRRSGDDAVEDPRVLLRFFIYQHNTDQSPVVDLIAEEEMGQDNSSSCPFLLFPSWSSRAEFLV